MKDFKVAGRYAKSLFDLAVEKGKLQEVFQDFSDLNQSIKNNKQLHTMLKSPVVPAYLKAKVLNQAFSSEFDNISMQYIELIVDKRREHLLPEIAWLLDQFYHEHMGIVKATVTSATEMGDENIATLRKSLENSLKKKIVLNSKVDESLIGGFVLRVADNQIDASLRTGLNEIRQNLVN
jgi:F-type H+-transporting ATPase subunit delta